jgi:hypothetical protein
MALIGRSSLGAVVRVGWRRHYPGAEELGRTAGGDSRVALGADRRSGQGRRRPRSARRRPGEVEPGRVAADGIGGRPGSGRVEGLRLEAGRGADRMEAVQESGADRVAAVRLAAGTDWA